MTAQLSREELQQIADTDHVQCGDAAAMARMLLAGMSSEPVAWRWNYGGTTTWRLLDTKPMPGTNPNCPRVIEPLYAAPPAPVAVPDAYELIAEAWRLMDGQNPQTAEWHIAASRYLNAHGRAAIQAEPVTAATTKIEKALKDILKFYPKT